MNVEDYEYLARTLASAIEAAMWSTDFTEQVSGLAAVQEALEHRAQGLPLPDAARLRLEILHTLQQSDEYADDVKAKEFGTMYCMLDALTDEERTHLATLLVELLSFVAKKLADA
jgi:hypothetical protein